jgi:formylglycine-generating enzyme required for sulfatase activity
LHRPEWREVLLLFGGVLYRQGVDKLDGFFKAVLELATRAKNLADEARCVGLVGAMLRDLAPFGYQLDDNRYEDMLNRVLAIFDKEKAKNISVNVRLEAADALGQAGDPRLNEDNMITIPDGSFLMGAQKEDFKKPNHDSSAYPDESPVHEVFLSSFQISKYLVTVAEYRRFIEEGGYEHQDFWQAGGWREFKEPDKWEEQLAFPNRPVVGVSWYEAKAYACWAEMELPTEAQWERAARGISSTYRKYPWGDLPPDGKIANSDQTELGHASPVGMFPDDCTEEGVLDMGGNVREWCRDWKDGEYKKQSIFYEKSAGSTDPLNDETGKWGKAGDRNDRVVRGGSWGSYYEDLYRCADRSDYRPDYRDYYLGFRVVRSAQL